MRNTHCLQTTQNRLHLCPVNRSSAGFYFFYLYFFLRTKIACTDTVDIKHLYRNMTAARVYTKFEITIIHVWFLTNVAS